MEKTLDTVILDKQHMSLETDVLQFGFMEKSSTVIYTSMLKETIDDYNNNKTDCYLLLLDALKALKAFDRVEYNQLFNRLHDRNMCPIV